MVNYKSDYLKFKNEVDSLKQNYKFQGLWHFTDFDNLASIFKEGYLLSRKECLTTHIDFVDGAEPDIINHTNDTILQSTRFYYRPQTPTLFNNEGIKTLAYQNKVHISRPVYLLFSDELIYSEATYFSDGNARHHLTDTGNGIDFFCNIEWANVFHNTPIPEYYEEEAKRNIIRCRQAELLSHEKVQLTKYLKNIIFRSNADLKQAKFLLGESALYQVNEKFFSDKDRLPMDDKNYNNFISDYGYNIFPNGLGVILHLKRPLNNFIIRFNIVDKLGVLVGPLNLGQNWRYRFRDKYDKETNIVSDAVAVVFWFDSNIVQGNNISFYLNNQLSIIIPVN